MSENHTTKSTQMVTEYRGIRVAVVSDPDGFKRAVEEAVAGIDYMLTRAAANGAPSSETKPAVEPKAETSEPKDDAPKPVGKKTYWKDGDELGVTEKGDILPEGAEAIKKAEFDRLTAEAEEAEGAEAEAESDEKGQDPLEPEVEGDITLDDLRALGKECGSLIGAVKTKAILDEFSPRLTEVDESDYAALAGKFKEAIANA